MQYVASMVSNRVIAPAMILNGVRASCRPKTMAPQVNIGSDPRYMSRTRNMKKAAIGKLTVVGIGLGLTVTTIKNTIGKRQKMTCKEETNGQSDNAQRL